jgi:hypothetical protein
MPKYDPKTTPAFGPVEDGYLYAAEPKNAKI